MSSRQPIRKEGPADLSGLDAGELRGMVARLRSENSSLASLSNFLLGSVTTRVLSLANVPVTVVP